jgi:starvation-inducible DNA-binding protein
LIEFVEGADVPRSTAHFRTAHAEQFVVHLRTILVAPNGHENSAKRPLLDKGIRYILETCRAMFTFASKPTRRMQMFPMKNDLPESNRVKTIDLLNARLADCKDLQTQVKQAHWNVKGPDFISLHLLFDQVNDAVDDYVDEIAERAVQLGGVAYGTARMVAKRTSLPEYPADAADGHVDALS